MRLCFCFHSTILSSPKSDTSSKESLFLIRGATQRMESGFSNINIKMESTDLHDQLAYAYKGDNIIPTFDSGEDFDGMISQNDIFSQDALLEGEDAIADNKGDADDMIFVYMDIRDPIKTLKTLLEQKTGINLFKYEVWLQNLQMLEPHKNLVDQCVKGEGLVQINAQVKVTEKRINIADVVKPTEEVLAEMSAVDSERMEDTVTDDTTTDGVDSDVAVINDTATNSNDSIYSGTGMTIQTAATATPTTSADDETDNAELINWVVDFKFKREQKQLKIPEDPREWSKDHVRYWLQWAIKQFQLFHIKMQEWNMNGKELCALTLEEFQEKVRKDPGNKFWTHLELLRKCNFIAVNHAGNPNDLLDELTEDEAKERFSIVKKSPRAIGTRPIKTIKSVNSISQLPTEVSPQGNRTGNNGQIQLWQFLLDILTDKDHRNIIQWIDGGEGEFKLTDPEKVASLWGERKNKPTMNYEKLSRALRYYYDGDMISKVTGKRFVYKFVCDLSQLIGYSAQELSDLVNESAHQVSFSKKL